MSEPPRPLESVQANPTDDQRHSGVYGKGGTMMTVSFRIPAAVLAFALIAAPAAGLAQSGTPTREGNIWDWRDHQPTMAQVQRQEKAAGIAPTSSQRDSNAATVDQLYQQL